MILPFRNLKVAAIDFHIQVLGRPHDAMRCITGS
jgi:hypothetical protein